MANISFGLDTNKYAQQTGFDQFQTGMFETLGEIAKDAWKYNPVSSAFRLSELEINRGRIDNEPLIDRQKLNDEYGKYNLFFEEDEKFYLTQDEKCVTIKIRNKIMEDK